MCEVIRKDDSGVQKPPKKKREEKKRNIAILMLNFPSLTPGNSKLKFLRMCGRL